VSLLSQIPFNDLQRSFDVDGRLLLTKVSEVCASGVFLNGSKVSALEARFSELFKTHHAVGVSNGTDALYLALVALGVSPRDKVATVGNAGGYATNAILRCGARPVLVEIDAESAQMSETHLESILSSFDDLKALVVTHLYGLMSDIDRLAELCKHHEVLLIEDCAQSFGAAQLGQLAGSWGDAAAFSFYPTKNLAALGDGGLVAFRDIEAGTLARRIAQYGWSSRYQVEFSGGVNSRLDEIQAAIVLNRLSSIESKNRRRREIVGRYAQAVVNPRRFIFENSTRYVGHLAVMRTPSRDRDSEILRDLGIATAIHYPIPDHHQPAWRHIFEGVVLPNSEIHCSEALSIPCFPELSEDEIDRVCEALQNL